MKLFRNAATRLAIVSAIAVSSLGLSALPALASTTTLAQSGDTSGIGVTGYLFRDVLSVSNATGTLTWASTTLPSGWSITSDGQLIADGTEAPTSYTLTGTVSDTNGDSGTWSYAANILGAPTGTITQNAPTSGTAVTSYPFVDNLSSAGTGLISYTMSGLPAGVSGAYDGTISATGTEAVGSYSLSGNVTDTFGDVGTWSYALNVTSSPSGPLTQLAPTTGSYVAGSPASYQLGVSGNVGNVAYSLSSVTLDGSSSSLPAGASFSSSGALVLPSTVSVGTYDFSGSVADTSAHVGSWSFTLTVQIPQSAPLSGSNAQGTASTYQLATSYAGSVTYTVTSTLPAGITVSSAGLISVVTSVPVGSYAISGTDVGTNPGDTGTWAFALTVNNTPITQTAPTSGTTLAGTPASFQMSASSTTGATVVFTATSTPPAGITVSSAGLVSVNNTVPMGTYNLSGTTSDNYNNTGTWAFTLNVNSDGVTLTQSAPTSGSTAQGSAASYQLTTTGQNGTESFATSSSLPAGVTLSSAGLISVATNTAVGVYNLSGTDSDTFGGSGTWSFTLNVTNAGITQTAPSSGSTPQGTPGSFQLTTSDTNTVTWTASSSLPTGVTVSSAGHITTTASTPVGVYNLTGTNQDSVGNTSTWAFALTISNAGITQTAPTSATLNAGTAGSVQLTTSDTNTVAFTASPPLPTGVTVSSTGLISIAATTKAGVYNLVGTTSDAPGNTGTWALTLTISSVAITQIAPTSATPTQGAGGSFNLATSDTNPVTYLTSSILPTGVTVSSSGTVTVSISLPAAVYTLSGTTSDQLGNTGTWTFTLTVKPAVITQTSPTSATITLGSTTTGVQLTTSDLNAVAYTTSSKLPAGVTVSTSGFVSVGSTATPGTYTLSGSDVDGYNNTGVWTLALTVMAPGVVTVAPLSIKVSYGTGYTGQLVATDSASTTPTFVYTNSTTSPGILVTSSGAVSVDKQLATPGTYTISGTVVNSANADQGTWQVTVSVAPAHNVITITNKPSSFHPNTTWAPFRKLAYKAPITLHAGPAKVCKLASPSVVRFMGLGVCTLTVTAAKSSLSVATQKKFRLNVTARSSATTSTKATPLYSVLIKPYFVTSHDSPEEYKLIGGLIKKAVAANKHQIVVVVSYDNSYNRILAESYASQIRHEVKSVAQKAGLTVSIITKFEPAPAPFLVRVEVL